ncbi:MAG: PilZ domain-containing protein [Myxococcota bacterium]
MENDPNGRRVHQRYPCDFAVTLVVNEADHAGKANNVSLGGMLIDGISNFPYGTKGTLRFQLPALKEETEVAVTVRWVTDAGMGVQFGSLRALEVWGLNELFKSIKG